MLIPSIIEVGIIVAIALLLLGDYLGYKISRMSLAKWGISCALGSVIIFAIYAIVWAFTRG